MYLLNHKLKHSHKSFYSRRLCIGPKSVSLVDDLVTVTSKARHVRSKDYAHQQQQSQLQIIKKQQLNKIILKFLNSMTSFHFFLFKRLIHSQYTSILFIRVALFSKIVILHNVNRLLQKTTHKIFEFSPKFIHLTFASKF